jgi:hypothetical protein
VKQLVIETKNPVINAMLADGRVVELSRDCDCLTHDGPHWLHTDTLTRLFLERDYRQPIEEIVKLGAAASPAQVMWAENLFAHYCQHQVNRLAVLRRNLEIRGIVRLIREESDRETP